MTVTIDKEDGKSGRLTIEVSDDTIKALEFGADVLSNECFDIDSERVMEFVNQLKNAMGDKGEQK